MKIFNNLLQINDIMQICVIYEVKHSISLMKYA